MAKPRSLLSKTLRLFGRLVVLGLVVGLVIGGVAYARSTNECAQPRPTPTTGMRAYIQCDYGPPEGLTLESIPRPAPNDSQVLVRVRAASVNPLDWHGMRGTPYVARMVMGLRKPSSIRIGADFAGVVESVGAKVTEFAPGDSVFGVTDGAFSEYVVARESRVVRKPSRVSLEQAAAIPVAALTALQALRDQGRVQPGQRVLINGASGGVGTFAVQIAKSLGAAVTGVCSTRNVEMVRSIGADQVVDYTKEDFTTATTPYDVIIDNVGNRSLAEIRRVLKPGGVYVIVGGSSGKWLSPLPQVAAATVTSWFVSQEMKFFVSSSNKPDFVALAALVEAGKVTPVIDRTYPFSEVREAIAYLETGRARGKVVVVVE